VIAARDLAFAYRDGAFQLRVPQLDIATGEKIALIGPSGSGKTTLLSLLCGILRPHAGSVRVEGAELAALSEAERRAFRIRRVGFVFQEFELLEYLRVRDNILLPFMLTDALALTPEVRATAEALARSTGIADKLGRYPRTLSHGEKQRTAICRALVTTPAVLAADEPTGNLDPATAREVLDLLIRQTAAHAATLIVVTHNHALLDAFDRVIDVQEFSSGMAA
jgi:putative ABC transport system ATP-binding protein